jgi:hypothetical protein
MNLNGPSKFDQTVTGLNCNREVRGSNLDREEDYPDSGIWASLSPTGHP